MRAQTCATSGLFQLLFVPSCCCLRIHFQATVVDTVGPCIQSFVYLRSLRFGTVFVPLPRASSINSVAQATVFSKRKKTIDFFLKIAARERTNMYINCNLVSPSFRSSMLSSVLSFWWGCSSLGKARDWHAADAGSIARCGKGFSPRVNFQCRLSYGVRTTRCAIACINICVRVKDPAVHVRVR